MRVRTPKVARAVRVRQLAAACLAVWSLLATVACAGPSSARPGAYAASGGRPMARGEANPGELRGQASWYGPGFAGRPTASGEPFDPRDFTAAHRTLPFGTVVRVVRVDTRQWVDVRINDRGPYAHGRVIDLSEAAAAEFDLIDSGVTEVWIEILQWPIAGR